MSKKRFQNFAIPERTSPRSEKLARLKAAWESRKIKNAAEGVKPNELLIYDSIGESFWGEGITGKSVRRWLDTQSGADVVVRLNSYGGDVFEGIAIHNVLTQYEGKVTCCIDSICASAASLIAMAGDEINIAANALLMVHKAWTIVAGNADDLDHERGILMRIDESIGNTYAARTGRTLAEIEPLLANETWFTAQEALEAKFVDAIVPAKDATDEDDEEEEEEEKEEEEDDTNKASRAATLSDAQQYILHLKRSLK